MPSLPIPRWFLFTALLIGGLYFVRWERREAIGEFSRPVSRLLDDRSNPTDEGFASRRARVCKILVALEEARKDHILPEQVLEQAYESLNLTEESAALLTAATANNLAIARRMGLLDDDNIEIMRNGELPNIAAGAFVGDEVDFEFIIPIEQAPELASHFANLELRPTFLSQGYGSPITRESMDKASSFYRAHLISQNSYLRIGAEYEQ